MRWILALSVICVVVIACSAAPLEDFGICAEMCSMDGGPLQCPHGYTCQSNGCGHTCQLSSSHSGSHTGNFCQPVLCALYCPSGFLSDENGCDTCTCA